ncbi:MAG: hypothetical protein KAH54_09995 [Candidatus Sabulitectum sp.]|nr:hypothetical protein [Candidatus Sabulitectum sp.]
MTVFSILSCLIGYSFIVIGSGEEYISLPDTPWLVPGTIVATVKGDTLSAVPASRGPGIGLILSPSPCEGDTVVVTADTLDLSIPSVAKLDIQPLDRGEAHELPSFYTGYDPIPEGLFISGSKRLGVSVGSGGGISQGTELSIEGILAPGITINGKITDRDLPLGSSSSEALSDLDKVYIAIDGGTWNAEMGDLDWEREGSVPWRSQVSGFSGGVSPVDAFDLSGGYGTTGSQRQKAVFLTEEGLQGPYIFAPGGGVTPGSERVFLDGAGMQRGSGADYEMDYAAGLITFTTARLIRRDQRVDISWYREGDGFRKDLTRLETDIIPFENFSFGFTGLSRGDNTGVPLGFIMTDEVEDALRNAGEDPSDAWIDGGTYVGDNNGSYTLDSLSRYSWAGIQQGDWSVEFQTPPEGAGDYIYDSSVGGYSWAGAGEGTHFARKYISIPNSIDLLGSTVTGEGGIVEHFGMFTNYSRKQGNLFNTEATTREGTLSGGELTLTPWESGPSMNLSGRYVSEGFNPPDDIDSDSNLAEWGLPPGWKGKDSFVLGDLGGERLLFTAGERFLEEGGTSTIAGIDYTPFDGVLQTSVSIDGLSRTGAELLTGGRRGVISTEMAVQLSSVTPFLNASYTGESWSDSLSGGLTVSDIGVLNETGSWRSTVTAGGEIDRREGISHPDKTLRLGAATDGSGMSWNANGSIQHSTGWFESGGSTSSDAVKAGYSGRTGGVWIYSQYSAGGYYSRLMDIVYTWVGSGNGDYSYDPETGEYYPDPSGDYRQTYIPGQGETRVLESSLDGGFTWADSANTAGMDGTFKLTASDPSDRLRTYTLAGAFDVSSPGGWNGSLAPYLTWEGSVLSRLTLRVSGFDQIEDYSGVGNTRETFRKLEAVPILKPENWLEIELSAMTAFRRRALYGNRETDEIGGSIDPVIITSFGMDTGFKVSGEKREERNGDLNALNWGFEPHVSMNGGGWTASGRFTAWYMPGEELIPSWFFEGRQSGWTLEPRLSVGRNINRWFHVTLFYWGRKPADSPWTQRGGLEGTVNF